MLRRARRYAALLAAAAILGGCSDHQLTPQSREFTRISLGSDFFRPPAPSSSP
jgi:hypothetical protein